MRQKLYSIEEGTSSSSRKRKSNTQTTATGPPKQVKNFALDENLLILKNANVTTQKKLIKEKLRDTLCIRKELLESPLELLNFSSWFPFFFTCPSLVRFKLMSNFQRIFFDYILITDFTRLLAKISKSEWFFNKMEGCFKSHWKRFHGNKRSKIPRVTWSYR